MTREIMNGTTFEKIRRDAIKEAMDTLQEVVVMAVEPKGLGLRVRHPTHLKSSNDLEITWIYDRTINKVRRRKSFGKQGSEKGELNLTQAKKAADDYYDEMKKPPTPIVPEPEVEQTLSQICDEYLLSKNFLNRTESYQEDILSKIKHYLKPDLGHLRFSELKKRVLMKWWEDLVPVSLRPESTGSTKRKIKTDGNSNAMNALRTLSTILTFYIEEHSLDATNPCIKWSRTEREKRPLPEREITADPELLELLGKAYKGLSEKFHISVQHALLVNLLTGARRNELEALECGWVKLTTRYARIELPPGFGKTDKKKRKGKKIYLGKLCRQIIEDYVSKCKSVDERVFKPVKGGSGKISLRRAWESIRKAIGKPDYHIHDQRHLFSSACIDLDVKTEVKEILLGHTVAKTIELRYGGAGVVTLQDVVNRVEEYIMKTTFIL